MGKKAAYNILSSFFSGGTGSGSGGLIKLPGGYHYHRDGEKAVSVTTNGYGVKDHDLYSIGIVGGKYTVSRKSGAHFPDFRTQIAAQLNAWVAK